MRYKENILKNHIDAFCEDLINTGISYNDLVIAYQDEWRKLCMTHRALAKNMRKTPLFTEADFLSFAMPLEYHQSEDKKTFENVILIAHTIKAKPIIPNTEYDHTLHTG